MDCILSTSVVVSFRGCPIVTSITFLFPGKNLYGPVEYQPTGGWRILVNRKKQKIRRCDKASLLEHIEPHGIPRCLNFSYMGVCCRPPTLSQSLKDVSFFENGQRANNIANTVKEQPRGGLAWGKGRKRKS